MLGTLHRSFSMISGLMALTAFGLSSGGAASGAEIADTLRYGMDDEQNINRLPQEIAERKGFFAREGLNVEIVRLASSFRAPQAGVDPTTEREAMANGSIDMSRKQLPMLVNDTIEGEGPFVGVGIAVSNPVYSLVVRDEIRSFADLRGKTVAVTGPHDGITLWTRELMELHGLTSADFETTRIAGTGARLACLNSGECAAAALAQPAVFEALNAGYRMLGTTNEIQPLLYQLDIANPAWAAANRDIVLKYIRATNAAKRFILDPENRDEVVRITMDYMQESEDRTRQMLAAIWDPKNRVLQQQVKIEMDNVRATISLLGKYGILTGPLPMPEQFVDTSYAAAAEQ